MARQVKHTVKLTRDGKWWVGTVQDIPGAATETKKLVDLEIEIRDLLAGLLDADDDDFDLSWDMTAVIGDAGQAAWDAFVSEREELYRVRRKFEEDRLAALEALRAAGVTVRDSAALVDLSFQRVAQLVG